MLLKLSSSADSIPSALTTWLQSDRDIEHEATLAVWRSNQVKANQGDLRLGTTQVWFEITMIGCISRSYDQWKIRNLARTASFNTTSHPYCSRLLDE
jgi:hypothetical protein